MEWWRVSLSDLKCAQNGGAGACSRMQWISQDVSRLTHRIREQARSHMGFVVSEISGSRRWR
ncbi:hypothetical protein C7A11_20595 [Pseudomonas simiae]|nr:hypothetical protein C7A11_20595 [Pseudomonas simiae]TKK01081.1 hypothetical protein PflCFBP13514_22760 [Pseudomonas fluorescens]